MSHGYSFEREQEQMDACDECGDNIDSYCQGYMDVAGVTVCDNCVNQMANEDGIICFRREGELVTFELTFNDGVFSEVCLTNDIFCDAIIEAGYMPVRSSLNTVTVTYEPPVMRKLKGLGDIEDVIISVGNKIYEILMC